MLRPLTDAGENVNPSSGRKQRRENKKINASDASEDPLCCRLRVHTLCDPSKRAERETEEKTKDTMISSCLHGSYAFF